MFAAKRQSVVLCGLLIGAQLVVTGCGNDQDASARKLKNVSGWDDTYMSLRPSWFACRSSWAQVEDNRERMSRFNDRLRFVESVNASIKATNPLRMVRLELIGVPAPVWQCVWIVEYTTNACLAYYMTEPGDKSTVAPSHPELIKEFAQLRIYEASTVSQQTFQALWRFLESQRVWRVHSDAGNAFDGACYFISVYDHGKTHQVGAYSPNEDFSNGARIEAITDYITHNFAGDEPCLTEKVFHDLRLESWMPIGAILTNVLDRIPKTGVLEEFAVFDAVVLSNSPDLLIVRDDDYGLLCRIRREKRRPFGCTNGSPCRARIFGLIDNVDVTNKMVFIAGLDVKCPPTAVTNGH